VSKILPTFPAEKGLEVSINLAVRIKCPMITMWALKSSQQELSAVFPAEGPIFALAKIIKVASAEARSIFASLAAAPLFAANSRKLRIDR
jgi:hypothetical protein